MHKHKLMIFVIAFLAIVIGILILVWFGQRSLIYYPDRSNPGSADNKIAGGKDIQITTEDYLTLDAWLVSPVENDLNIAVLYLPGNGGNRLGRLEPAEAISKLGYTVLLLDYRGYGGNPGTPSEEGLVSDARAAAHYLMTHGFPQERILYVGESIGTGVAAQLAVTDPPAGIVLRSPYTSLADVAKAQVKVPVNLILRDKFETLKYLPDINVPITVLCGSEDTLVPASQSATVAEHVVNLHDFIEVKGRSHNDDLWFGPYLAKQIDSLAKSSI